MKYGKELIKQLEDEIKRMEEATMVLRGFLNMQRLMGNLLMLIGAIRSLDILCV